jgi:predicted ATP-dependent endonuclease of OLD family
MPRTHNYSGIELDFHVTPESKPPSNIHVLIGRNGVGKTTFLNNLIRSILQDETLLDDFGNVFDETSLSFSSKKIIKDDYFTSIISLSFSAFDPFTPPRDQPDRNKGTCFYYVGLKNNLSTSSEDSENGFTLKNQSELNSEFCDSLATCLSLSKKKSLWSKAIETLESDSNFQEMELWRLTEFPDNHNEVYSAASTLFSKLSSGHAIVILSITKLIEKLEEKTLVLIDEPESHLHPPLLSAFTRVLSNLLVNRNGVAIIATHSPVVLQEVPSSCVWKLFRTHLSGKAERPEIQTFGENVGTLTREVFGLEVTNSGFHNLLKESAEAGESYDSILAKYKHQLGFEGKAVLRALLANLENQEEESL